MTSSASLLTLLSAASVLTACSKPCDLTTVAPQWTQALASNVTPLAGCDAKHGAQIVVDDTHAYWTESGAVRRVSLTAPASADDCAETLLTDRLSASHGLAVDDAFVYVAAFSLDDGFGSASGLPAIVRIPKGGGDPAVLATSDDGAIVEENKGLVLAGGFVYVLDGRSSDASGNLTDGGTLQRVPVNGGEVETLVAAEMGAEGLRAHGDTIHWTRAADGVATQDGPRELRRLGEDGAVETLFSARARAFDFIGADPVWIDTVSSALLTMPAGASAPVQLAAGLDGVSTLDIRVRDEVVFLQRDSFEADDDPTYDNALVASTEIVRVQDGSVDVALALQPHRENANVLDFQVLEDAIVAIVDGAIVRVDL